ncbi:MAG: toll/interleukin-1 receptor domain-containing protein [Oscillospiraceae bacterium]|nr:toll/interleukin-1 receptor domain-containing protein [Oscillospiraceae bacterium]
MTDYDIFISYRRNGGETMALLLHDRLTARGYRVFLDVESLNAGSFNTKLLDVIDGCKDVIVVLSENSLDRCVNEDDWVRNEISHAFKKEKNIIPFMLRGFAWPEKLADDIADLPMQNGINAISNEYFDAAIERLTEKFLVSTPHDVGFTPKTNKNAFAFKIVVTSLIFIFALIIVILIIAAVFLTNNPDILDGLDADSIIELLKENQSYGH